MKDWRRKPTASAGVNDRHFQSYAPPSAIPSATPVVLTALTYAWLLLAYHVKADADFVATYGESTDAPPFHQRVQTGPFGLSNVDLILFGAFIFLAFETLQFLVQGSGSTLHTCCLKGAR